MKVWFILFRLIARPRMMATLVDVGGLGRRPRRCAVAQLNAKAPALLLPTAVTHAPCVQGCWTMARYSTTRSGRAKGRIGRTRHAMIKPARMALSVHVALHGLPALWYVAPAAHAVARTAVSITAVRDASTGNSASGVRGVDCGRSVGRAWTWASFEVRPSLWMRGCVVRGCGWCGVAK